MNEKVPPMPPKPPSRKYDCFDRLMNQHEIDQYHEESRIWREIYMPKQPLMEDNTKPHTTEYVPMHKRYVTVTKEVRIDNGDFILLGVLCFIAGLCAGGIFL